MACSFPAPNVGQLTGNGAMASKEQPTEEKKGGSKLVLVVIILVVALLAAGGAGAAVFFLTKKPAAEGAAASAEGAGDHEAAAHDEEEAVDEEPAKKKKRRKAKHNEEPAVYVEMKPSLVINLDDGASMRFLQLDISLQTHGEEAAKAVELHMPKMRNDLMLLYSQKRYQDLLTRDGKEALQQESLEKVQDIMYEETGEETVDGLFFTTFVMQ